MRFFFAWLLLAPVFLLAQALPTIEEKTKGLTRLEGYFPLYRDDQQGKLWLEINKFDQEILYVTSLPAGLGSNDIGLDRGIIGGEFVVKFQRTGRKILLFQPNYNYRATGSAAEKRAVEQSFASSVLWGFTAEAATGDRYLVDLSDFLLRDAMKAANRIRGMKQGNFAVDKSRSALYFPATKNFPFNTEMEASVTLVNNEGGVGNYVSSVSASPDAITLRMHHAFVQLPDDNYKPRVLDPRAGFFGISYFDYSTPVSAPIEKFFINRHRLQKKDPTAAMSEPVKPIIYYLDNGTPEPIRSALLDGARWWNQAFTAAGYKDAFRVEILPDSADPMDIRYNMINWVHRSTRGWSFGGAVSDPRTGEIIKGNVTLGSLRVRQDYLIAQGLLSPFAKDLPANDPMLQMALARLRQLAAHEVGHTLGIAHNYIASAYGNSSVMDYLQPQAMLDADGKISLANAYDDKIGDWDKLTINWGYNDLPAGTDEAAWLDKTLQDGIGKNLLYITDRDARAAGGAHPQAHLWDNGKDAVNELTAMVKIRTQALQQFGENTVRTGTPLAFLEDALVPVYFYHRYQLEAVTKIIGGVNYRYAVKGDHQPVPITVSKAEQLRALDAVIQCIDPAFLNLPEKIIALIPPRPGTYDFTRELFSKRTGLPFDALSPAEAAADFPFSFLFHPERLSRLEEQAATGGLSSADMANKLINATFKAKRKTGMEALLQLQTEQVLLTYLLHWSVDEKCNTAARASAVLTLKQLKQWVEQQQKITHDPRLLAHYALVIDRMASPEKAVTTEHVDLPPGAPIGCEMD